MKVVFSNRAYTALLSETYEKITTETGGVFLGYYEDETWYIVEAIDPGPASIFEVAYFEYDKKYVTHLINKIARMYKKNLSLIGLWHRHPGSFDIFSNTDDGTNYSYAQLAPQGAISALVNIDPRFRLTVYHVPKNLKYKKIPYEVGDQHFPKGVLDLLTSEELHNKINQNENADYIRSLQVRIAPKMRLSEMMSSICSKLKEFDVTEYMEEIKAETANDEFLERISGEVFEDLEYLTEKANIAVKVKMTARYLCMFDDSGETVIRLFFSHIGSIDKFILIYESKSYEYSSGMFARIIEEGISSEVEDDTSFWGNLKKIFKIKRR